jgi:hypothetical protein
MRCFRNSSKCHGKVRRGRGARDNRWLKSPVIDHKSGYCEEHFRQSIPRARRKNFTSGTALEVLETPRYYGGHRHQGVGPLRALFWERMGERVNHLLKESV